MKWFSGHRGYVSFLFLFFFAVCVCCGSFLFDVNCVGSLREYVIILWYNKRQILDDSDLYNVKFHKNIYV